MKRAAIEKVRTLHTWRRHLATHALPIRCDCEFQVGRFRKGQRVGGCSTPKCYTCHFEKLARVPTVQVRRFVSLYREGLAETARPNQSFNTDVPPTGLRPLGGPPVNLFR